MTALPLDPTLGHLPAFGRLGAVPYHVSYATADLEAVMASFSDLLGVRWCPIEEGLIPGLGPADTTGWESRRAVTLHGPVHLELSWGSPGSIWATDALAELHHLAYWSTDLPAAVAGLVEDGWELELTLPDAGGAPSEFAYLHLEGWPRLELVDTKRTAAFLESKEHRGAGAAPTGGGAR
jgi:hypothetical protein